MSDDNATHEPAPVTTVPAPVAEGGEEPRSVQIIELADLGDFEYEEGQPLPDDVQALDGIQIRTRGFLIFLEADLFLVVRELWDHHFGSPPDLHEAIVATVDPVVRRYAECPTIVQGTLYVGEEIEDGYVVSLFRMMVDSVEVDVDAVGEENTQGCTDHPPYDRGRANIAR